MPPLIADLKVFHRELQLITMIVHSEGLSAVDKLVLDGDCHIGISVIPREIPVTGASLERRFLTSVEMVPVVASGHALAQLGRPISTAELQDHSSSS